LAPFAASVSQKKFFWESRVNDYGKCHSRRIVGLAESTLPKPKLHLTEVGNHEENMRKICEDFRSKLYLA
jgi:hypothetical protein